MSHTRARVPDEDDSPEPKKTPWASPPPPSPTQTSSAGGQLSPEQLARMEKKKLEAGARLLAKRLGTSNIGPSWVQALQDEFKKTYMEKLISFVTAERLKGNVYPPVDDVFTWTTAFPISEVKVVIIGQDPYHGPKQAHGLCFSVRVGVQIPPSLRNMYKELMQDIDGFVPPDHGYLAGWAKQGVLLLNACLTVREREPNSHEGKGWERLTDAVIHWINDHCSGVVFLLWGAYAQKKGAFINQKRHCVLKTVHPSPLSASRGFFGCKHFSKANEYLEKNGGKEIDWKYLPTDLQL
jgi:uracil-DNA glycosylase